MFLLLLICVVDIKLNPSPRKNNTSYTFLSLCVCLCSLKSIATHHFSKLSLLEAYNIKQICLSKTLLAFSILLDDVILHMKEYRLINMTILAIFSLYFAASSIEVKSLNE